MNNLGCQLDYIWSQLKEARHTCEWEFSGLNHLRWKTHPKSGPSGGSPYKRTQKKEASAFCLLAPSLSLASSSIL